MSDHDMSIDGSLLRLQRESRGWTMTDMAVRSCLSVKQIRQLEEGGSESFYSEAVKLTAAKKVASLLGLSTEQVLGQPQPLLPSSPDALLEPSTGVDDLQSVHSDAETHLQDISSSSSSSSSSAEAVAPVEVAPFEPEQPALTPAPKSTHMSLWVMAALFAAALLVAAWLNPSAESVATDAEPPVQALPTDISESASAVVGVASDAVNSASVASQTRVTGVQAASSAASSSSVRASDAAEAASR
jgi:transcriptional regulator with XRE-family HTH domain